MKTYRVLRLNLIFLYALLGFLTLVGVVVEYTRFFYPGAPAMGYLDIVWFAVVAWLWYFYLRIPVAVTWREDGVLEFKSPLRTAAVPVDEIIAIKAVPLGWGFIRMKYHGGSLRLMNQITGLYELIGSVKAQNPRVEIKGC